jgi:hypothetical protein
MFGNHFYHQKIRKCVAIFGAIFNNLYVLRKDSNGNVVSQVKVPLSYAPKDKYLERIRENANLSENTQVAIKLPRMSFEITSFTYDADRQLTKLSNFTTKGTANSNRQKFYSPVPYSINFQLNIYAKNQDDALQLVEQIIPTFNPQYSLTIKPFATEYPDFKEDIPIIIQGVSFADDFEGALDQRRTILYTLDFEMKVQFYGNITSGSIIREVNADLYIIEPNENALAEKIVVTPNPTDIIGLADSDFGFTVDINSLDTIEDTDPYVVTGYMVDDYVQKTL